MSKKILWTVTIFSIVFILSIEHSQAMYLPSMDEDLSQERFEEAKEYAFAHPEFLMRRDPMVEIFTNERILEEWYRRLGNWWEIAKSEWGTAGISTLGYFSMLDHNILAEIPSTSAIILTPFLMVVANTLGVEATKELYEIEKKEEPLLSEMGYKSGEVTSSYIWFFHIPLIVYSDYSLPPETKYILRYYPEDYLLGIDEKMEAEAVYINSRESLVGEESVGFFYYLAFPTEDILFSPTASFSSNEEISELLGRMVLMIITKAGEKLVFPFDLSKMR